MIMHILVDIVPDEKEREIEKIMVDLEETI